MRKRATGNYPEVLCVGSTIFQIKEEDYAHRRRLSGNSSGNSDGIWDQIETSGKKNVALGISCSEKQTFPMRETPKLCGGEEQISTVKNPKFSLPKSSRTQKYSQVQKHIKLDLVEIINIDKQKDATISSIGNNIKSLKEKMYGNLSKTIKSNFELKL